MKIDNHYTNFEFDKMPARAGQPATGAAGPTAANKTTAPEHADAARDAIVNLSQASKEASLIEDTIANTPDIRQEKVMAIKEQIAAGQYELNPSAIANKMVDQMVMDFSKF
jgi:negative regulator of flagellin synthesis FlgM